VIQKPISVGLFHSKSLAMVEGLSLYRLGYIS
jgi:hypothetical protein